MMFHFRCYKKYLFLVLLILFLFWFIWFGKFSHDSHLNGHNNDLMKENYDITEFYKKIIKNLNVLCKPFLINVDLLELFSSNQIGSHLRYSFDELIQNASSNLVFGVYEKYVDSLKQNSKFIEKLGCDLKVVNCIFLGKIVPSIFYLTCDQLEIQLTIFYKRENFYWIGDGNSDKKKPKWFGDFPRGMNNFETTILSWINSVIIETPKNINRFLYDYKHSKFIECNKANAKFVAKKMGLNYKMDEDRKKKMLSSLIYVTSVLEYFKKNYWIAAGTLLGWYRECGLIPHTFDVDIAMWDHDYENNLKNYFRGNSEAALGLQLGLVNEGFELRLLSKSGISVDIFLIYKLNKTYQWQGYHSERKLYRQLLHHFEEDDLCSGELYDHKFVVPCNIEEYLRVQYGENEWKLPLESSYFHYHTISLHKKWSNEEWPYVYRYYVFKTGKINVQVTLKHLNKYSDKLLYKLPDYFD